MERLLLVVTGAGNGYGRFCAVEISRALHPKYAHHDVVLMGRDMAALQGTLALMPEHAGEGILPEHLMCLFINML